MLDAKAPVNAQMWEIGAQIPRGFPQDYAYEVQWTNEKALEGMPVPLHPGAERYYREAGLMN